MDIFFNDTNSEFNTDNTNSELNGDNAPNQTEANAATIHQTLSWSKNALSMMSRVNKVVEASHHSCKAMNQALSGSGILVFKLVLAVLFSFYGMFKLLNDPETIDIYKIAKLLQAHTVMILLIAALLCPIASIPIVFLLSTHDFIVTSFELFYGYHTMLQLTAIVEQSKPNIQTDTLTDKQENLAKETTKYNKLIQKLLLVTLTIIGISLTLFPPTQLAGTIMLLLSTAGGIGTSFTQPISWHGMGQRLSHSMGMFARKLDKSTLAMPTWANTKHCLVV